MQRTEDRQAGFGLIVVLVVVLAVVAISAVGWIAYQRHAGSGKPKASATTYQSTTQQQSTTTTQSQQTAATTLNITEWGVHMTLDSTTASMYYYIPADNPNVAYLSLKKISDLDPLCAANQNSLGAIYRQTTNSNAATSPNTTIQIGSYWYRYALARAGCVDSTHAAAVQQAVPGYSDNAMIDTFNTLAAN